MAGGVGGLEASTPYTKTATFTEANRVVVRVMCKGTLELAADAIKPLPCRHTDFSRCWTSHGIFWMETSGKSVERNLQAHKQPRDRVNDGDGREMSGI